ncbi:hypothetical protein [Lysinibacillus odysseyi]|uniref:Transcription initiation factor TFIIIB n=1 Tax=Lysinibacillus odysseyi 34hs-1 = NBRC 100172 TaxID=1220589 RepID=A0A0A3IGC3_9BACI|nr:hypothetical protein [Lysinibacillus odysseyi]KGR81863.1 hypothetical protein CD32_21345 [Lysinibacillus odysseyi 34hs-1 = NBRC 100172]
MGNEKLVCKACGSDTFTTGQVGGTSSQGNIRPIGSIMAVGSPLIMTFCKSCGEVASIKVENPKKFK